jgi:hypothetical protein
MLGRESGCEAQTDEPSLHEAKSHSNLASESVSAQAADKVQQTIPQHNGA